MCTRKWTVVSKLILVLFLTTPLLTGCWDRLEVEQRAAVLGIAIDSINAEEYPSIEKEMKSSDSTGSTQVPSMASNLLRLTAQIAVPGRIPLGPGEGGGGGTSPKSAVWILHAEGKTLDDAVERLQQQVADKLFLGHVRVIVVSSSFVKEHDIQTFADFLRRNPEVRRTAWLVITEGNAEEVMKTSPPLERVPTLYLMATMDHAQQMGKLPNDFLGVFESTALMKGREGALPYLRVVQKDNVEVAGLALFKGYKMVGTTKKPFDISSYMSLEGVKRGGYSAMVPLPGKSETVMWRAYRRKTKIKVDIRNGIPHFNVNVHIDGTISEKSGEEFTVDDPATIKAIDREIVRIAEQNARDFINETQKLGVDVVGFGEYVRAKEPRYWDSRIKTKEQWEKIYPQISVDVHFTSRTHRVGMKVT